MPILTKDHSIFLPFSKPSTTHFLPSSFSFKFISSHFRDPLSFPPTGVAFFTNTNHIPVLCKKRTKKEGPLERSVPLEYPWLVSSSHPLFIYQTIIPYH